MTTIGIVVFDEVEELDFVGPWQVFQTAVAEGADARVLLLAERAGPLRCAKGLQIVAESELGSAPALDLLLVPGGQGTRREAGNPRLLAALAAAGAGCAWVTSVCTGSLLLHASGLARGRRITTHWGFVESLRARAADATVLEGVRYVRDGRVVTAAGVSAGIDMALWLVGQLFGVACARRTQRRMEYDPAPPYQAEV